MDAHRERGSDALCHAWACIGISLVVRVAVVNPVRGGGTGADNGPSGLHGCEDLSPSVVSGFDNLVFLDRGIKFKLGITLQTACGMTDIDESEGDTVISSGGVGAGTCFYPHGQLSG